MSDEATRVLHVLEDWCREAQVSPADGTEEAGLAVCAVIMLHPLLPHPTDVLHCVVNELLRRLSRVQHLVVTTERVLLTRVGVAGRRRYERSGVRHERESVMLPPAVKAAVALFDAPGGMSRRVA